MYYAGSYRESVTRYSHKDVTRWMLPAKQSASLDWFRVGSNSVVLLCVTMMIAIGVVILQAA